MHEASANNDDIYFPEWLKEIFRIRVVKETAPHRATVYYIEYRRKWAGIWWWWHRHTYAGCYESFDKESEALVRIKDIVQREIREQGDREKKLTYNEIGRKDD